jgi:hypothetical protein
MTCLKIEIARYAPSPMHDNKNAHNFWLGFPERHQEPKPSWSRELLFQKETASEKPVPILLAQRRLEYFGTELS